MDLEIFSIGLVMLAAVFHAVWNACLKSGEQPLLTLALLLVVGGIVPLFALPFLQQPAPESWKYIVISISIHVGYFFFLLLSYRAGDLSHVYPIARGTSPLSIALLAWLAVGESLNAGVWIGVFLVSVGIMSLTFATGMPNRKEWSAVGFAVMTGLFITAYTLIDGIGVRKSGAPLGYIAWLFVLDPVPIVPVAVRLKWGTITGFLRTHWKRGTVGGLLASSAYGIVIWAMAINPMAYISALRETSVIFAAAIGCYVLGESFGKRRVVSAGIVAAGTVLMSIWK